MKTKDEVIAELTAKNDTLLEALRTIRDSPHNVYRNNERGTYGIGVTDGHRCSAGIAKIAIITNWRGIL